MKEREMLIDLRSQLVGKLHTQPFTIYTDKTIDDLCKAKPKSLNDLAKIKGFPAEGKRIKGFGEAVVAIFTQTSKIKKIEVTGTCNSQLSIGVQLKQMEVF